MTERPDQMWILFAGLASTTAIALILYNLWVARATASSKAADG